MPPATHAFTTGHSLLPDLGELKYNGCTFSPLFATTVSGIAIKDAAKRTVMYMEYTITVDGYVTAPTPFPIGFGVTEDAFQDTETDARDAVFVSMNSMRDLLTKQGGELVYRGRGLDLIVNPDGGADTRDVAWGPAPELFEFQPLGGGLSAKVQWQVKVRVTEITREYKKQVKPKTVNKAAPPGVDRGPQQAPLKQPGQLALVRAAPPVAAGGAAGAGAAAQVNAFGAADDVPMLQFNYETVVSYGEDQYSSATIRGTLEIPLTRTPNQKTRTLQQTADNLRGQIESRVMRGIDLSLFRVTRRDFALSRDKRVLTWDIQIEEKPYMDLPMDCPLARGSYSVRPTRAGMGLSKWICTLRVTYTVRRDRPRRTAWLAFLSLLRLRMGYSVKGVITDENNNAPGPGGGAAGAAGAAAVGGALGGAGAPARGPNFIDKLIEVLGVIYGPKETPLTDKAWLIDFNIDEGLYLDAKIITFSASWQLVTNFSHILLASGIWTKLEEYNQQGNNLWATSIRDISGAQSWLTNRADPDLDVIVDFGGG